LFVYDHELKKLVKSDIPVGLMKNSYARISHYSAEEILIYEGRQSTPKLYNKKTKKVKILPQASSISRVAGGRIWDGLSYLDTQKKEWVYALPEFQENIPNFIPSTSFYKEIAHDIDSSIWIATSQGLFNYNLETKQSKHYTHDPNEPNSLSTNICQFIFEGSNRRMYMITTNGLSIYDPQKDHFNHYTTKNGLLHDHVHTIVEDAEGNPWIGSAIGLQKLDLKTGKFSSYSVYDGLPNEFIHGGKSFRDPAGYLYFISMNEAFRFHPDSLPVRDYSAPVYLMDFFLEREPVQVGAADSILQNMLRYMPELNLTYDQNDFGFSFSMPVFYKAEETEYYYRLAPYQKEWQTAGQERQIHYTNIDEGKYTFEVKAKTVSGVWSTQAATIPITIFPPWYRTWWAYTTYFLLFSALILLLFRYYRNRLLLRQQLVFEQQEAQRLKELDGFKTRLFTNITHEFRTPLTVIMGMTDNIKGHQNEKNLISKNSKNLLHLVNELLDLSKLEAGEMKLHNIHANIIPYLKYLTESFHSMAKERQIDLRFQSESEELVMDFDESKIQHIVYNLLSNALKFSNAGDQVVLQVTKEEQDNTQYLQLRVSDTGKGIEEKDLAHLFDRFYQADATSTRKGEGTGIGLALTKELVELMDGEISVKSKFGEGTDFTILLPIKKESSVSALKQVTLPKSQTPVATSIKLPPQDNPSNEKPQLLIIEDNQDITIYISTLLGSEYQISMAQNGQEGIDKAIEIIPDIIISDVMMPEKNGYEVCEILKQDERSSHIPIILLTAKATQEAKVEGLKYGADAYLTKPFHKEELLVRLEQLVALRKQLQAKYTAQQANETSKTELLPLIENAFLQKLNAAIISHLDDTNFSVAQLAQIMLLSQVQLYRKVKALTGKNTMLYIRSLRLKKAKELLLNSELNISEIAYEVGFSDPSYFSRVFQQEFSHPPTFFRK